MGDPFVDVSSHGPVNAGPVPARRFVDADRLAASRWRAAIAICVLNVLDLVTTYTAIKVFGAEEGNPVTVWLVDTYLIVVAKLLVCLAVVWAAGKAPVSVRSVAASWFVVGMYALAVVVNTMHIVRAA